MLNDIIKKSDPEVRSKIALTCGKEEYTYAQLDEAIDNCARKLIKMGVAVGDRVGIWSFNSANYIIAFFAIIRVGAVAVPVNYSMTLKEATDLMELVQIKYVLYGPVLAARNNPDVFDRLFTILKLDKTAAGMNLNEVSFTDETDTSVDGELLKRIENDNDERDAFVIFTTGSTSKPKAVLDTQGGILETTGDYLTARGPVMGNEVTVCLPLFHIFAIWAIVSYFRNNSTVHFASKVDAGTIINDLKEHDVTDICSVTAIYLKLLEHPEFGDVCKKPTLLTTAGGVLTPVQFMKMEQSFPNAKLFNEYGLTENHGTVTTSFYDDPIEKRAYTLGRAVRREAVRIFADGKMIETPGVIGEIAVRGKSVMNGYYSLPPESQAVDAEGWLHTGDLGFFDEDGYMKLAGREKDIIIKNGENISPIEVETQISAFPEINNVKVFGAAHPLFGESVECCIVLNEGEIFDEDCARTRLKQTLASAKIPSHFFIFDSFPLAPSGKLDQKGLRIEMLKKLKGLQFSEEIVAGKCIFSIKLRNTLYNIKPVSLAIEAMGEQLGFSKARLSKLELCCEEFLSLRIVENKADVGDLIVKCLLEKEWLSIIFSDTGAPFEMEKSKENSMCAKLILMAADYCEAIKSDSGRSEYKLDLLYEKDFDVVNFLVNRDVEFSQI